MSENQLTYEDVMEYEKFFTLAPPFLLERFAKKNTNIVSKFRPKVQDFMNHLNDDQLKKLDILLNTDIADIQKLMDEVYKKTGKKQYKILANPKYKQFIEDNLNELAKMIE